MYHVPVLLKESINGLDIKPNGIYVDVTFGGGGHSRTILEKLDKGKLVAFDQDQDAAENASKLYDEFPERSFVFVQANFKDLKKYLKLHSINKVDGVLADLGVSSHQFNESDRGFSIRFDGPLDMRMNQNQSLSAEEVINGYDERDLVHMFSS